ncbi:MAG: tRNA (N6-threonylcarbamoyladenosine(37)-N6)-methyltransferase TrmO [Clostridia bacterium]|nr:tRNA (N6-threonylcarbamoyladenosine(37)-N6)-methyltransferase TrmO [Clostridia bacterium]
MKKIATVRNDFKEKFGIPRQSGLCEDIVSRVVFEPEYRCPEALRGITDFSHLWLIFEFSKSIRDSWSPTVRPPRLGGNKRVGVFATRSPFRPSPIGLSSVRLLGLEETPEGTVLLVGGADLLDGTPIYDIKPYLPYTDSHPDASFGYAKDAMEYELDVVFPDKLLSKIPSDKQNALKIILSQDPRPSYINDADRVYTFRFADYEISFTVADGTLTVTDVRDFIE